jgi:hypothetical protein
MIPGLQAFYWNEHEDPQEVREGIGPITLEQALMGHLETKEYGRLVRTYPGGELTLHYRAFTDEFRGRQIVGGVDLAEMDRLYQQRKRECSLRVFSPAELYALTAAKTDYGSWHTVSVHFRDDGLDYYGINLDAVEKTQRFETRTLVDHCSDGRRTWTLQTVWFDGKPVMVVNSSGRDGDEYHERWITDALHFGKLVTFLKSFMPEPEASAEFVEASAKIPAMTEFYNGTIHDFYDTEAQEPKKL